MKVFVTLATILGASSATPLFQNQLHGSNNLRHNQQSMQGVMKPSMGMSMENHVSQHDNIDRHMDMNHQMSNMRDMYRDNQDMSSSRNMMHQEMNQNMMDRNMMGQDMRSNMRNTQRQNQAFGPNQYFVKDDFGNYAYSYNDQQSEKSEESNAQSIKGQYAYIMSNGVKRLVEYVADNNGFHIIRDNADPARIKRSSEPDLVQTQMTSAMGSSMRNDVGNMQRMSHMMGRDISSQMDRNLMGMDQQRYSNMMMGRNMVGQDSIDRLMMGQDNTGHNMMGRNIYNIMSNRGMTSDMSNMMNQQMDSNMMGRDMTMDVMGRNMMGQDRSSQMMRRNMMGHQNMTPNMMYNNMMGQDMMDMANNQMSSNMMGSRGMSSGIISNNGQRMMQKMEIERVPETYTSTRFI